MRPTWLFSVAALVAVTGCAHSHAAGSWGKSSAATNPPVFLAVEGGNFNLVVRSVRTGSTVRNLADNAGAIALSPNGITAYYQGGQPGQSALFSVPVAGGTPARVGIGSAPSVSPDSSKLAYVLSGSTNLVAVYDVASRTTQKVDVSRLIGPGYHLGNTRSLVAWVSNSLLVAIPLHDASFSDSRGSERATVASQKATVGSLRQRAVVIDLAAANSARVFNIAVSGGLNGVAGPGPSPGTLLIAADNAVDRYGVTADSMTASGSVPVPSGGIVEALSPDGRDALYLLRGGISTPPPTEPVGSGVTAPPPPYQSGIQLWEATMGRSFSSPRLVFGNAQLYGAAW